MKNHGRYRIYMTGSKCYIDRSVYEDKDGKCYIKWYGQMVEVKHSTCGYVTVESY